MPIQIHVHKSKHNEVPIPEQIFTQIVMGIVSNDLKPNEQLPSRSKLAERHGIHANTVGEAYHELAARGWVEYREGLGFFVRPPARRPTTTICQLIASFIEDIHRRGFTVTDAYACFGRMLPLRQSGRVILIEPDPQLRAIFLEEIRKATGFQCTAASLKECADPARLANAVPVALYTRAALVRAKLPRGTHYLLLHTNSLTRSLNDGPLPPRDALITVVSGSNCWRQMARTILAALGHNPLSLNLCDPRESGWQRCLRVSDLVLADTLVALRLPANYRARIHQTLSTASLEQLRGLFLSVPAAAHA